MSNTEWVASPSSDPKASPYQHLIRPSRSQMVTPIDTNKPEETVSNSISRVDLNGSNPVLAPFVADDQHRPPSSASSTKVQNNSHVNVNHSSAQSPLQQLVFSKAIGSIKFDGKEYSSTESSKHGKKLQRQDGNLEDGNSVRDGFANSQLQLKGRAAIKDSVSDMTSILGEDVVNRLKNTEAGLRTKLESFDRSVSELQQLKTRSSQLVDKFESNTTSTKKDLASQLESVQSKQTASEVIDELERRIHRARNKVDEGRHRLAKVNDQISSQENENKQRRKRIVYAKRGAFVLTVLLLAIFLALRYEIQRYDDFHNIIHCLQDLDACYGTKS